MNIFLISLKNFYLAHPGLDYASGLKQLCGDNYNQTDAFMSQFLANLNKRRSLFKEFKEFLIEKNQANQVLLSDIQSQSDLEGGTVMMLDNNYVGIIAKNSDVFSFPIRTHLFRIFEVEPGTSVMDIIKESVNVINEQIEYSESELVRLEPEITNFQNREDVKLYREEKSLFQAEKNSLILSKVRLARTIERVCSTVAKQHEHIDLQTLKTAMSIPVENLTDLQFTVLLQAFNLYFGN
jgi:hypothetical protein